MSVTSEVHPSLNDGRTDGPADPRPLPHPPVDWNVAELSTLSAILGRKWTASVVSTLRTRPLRHGQLCRRLSGISRKVLHESLDGLIRDGIVEKIVGVDETGGTFVAYGLTSLGNSLSSVYDAMQMWCTRHLPEVEQSRRTGGAPIRIADLGTEDAGNPGVTTVTLK